MSARDYCTQCGEDLRRADDRWIEHRAGLRWCNVDCMAEWDAMLELDRAEWDAAAERPELPRP
jgi:hypothetical protein